MIKKICSSRWIYLFIFAFYSVALWQMSVPLTGDQKVYISIALEMRERGEWIIPYLYGVPNFLKPPLQYWATLVGWKLFGLGLFGALLPSVLALLGSSYLVNHIYRFFSPSDNSQKTNHLPGLFFASSLGTMTYGTTGQMEIWIVLFYLSSWYLFLLERWLFAFVVVGVMAWVKGPLYPVLWVFSTALYLFYKKRLVDLISMRYLVGLCVGVLIALLWYAAAAYTHWDAMMAVFFMRENFGKIQTAQGTPWGLWGEFIYSLLPWSLWMIMLLSDPGFRKSLAGKRHFWIAFAAIPAAFFTFFPYRVYTYLYLLTPLAAWLVSEGSEQNVHVRNKFNRFMVALVSVVALVLSFLVVRLTTGNWIGGEIAIPMIAILVFWAISHQKRNPYAIALTSLVLVNLIRVAAVEIGERDLAGLRAYHFENKTPLAYYLDNKDIWHEFGLVSSALNQDIARIEQRDELDKFVRSGGTIILQDAQADLAKDLHCTDWYRIRRRLKFPIQQFIVSGIKFGSPEVMRTFHLCRL